jgi:hypothetical protein
MFKNTATVTMINELGQINIDELKRPELKGVGFDFQGLAENIRQLVDNFKKIASHSTEIQISIEAENGLKTAAEALSRRLIPLIKNFRAVDNPNSTNDYNAILNQYEKLYSDFSRFGDNLLNKIAINEWTPEKIKLEVDAIDKLKKEIENTVVDLGEKRREAEAIIRQASGIGGSEIISGQFKGQATEHKKWAKWWFVASIISLGALILLAFLLFYGVGPFTGFKIDWSTFQDYQIIQIFVFKLIILSAGYFILHQCIKNYKIHRHLYIVNQHRHNALWVYPKMLTAGEYPESRAIIVEYAAQSIFGQVASGYLKFDDDPRPLNPTAVVNKIIDGSLKK